MIRIHLLVCAMLTLQAARLANAQAPRDALGVEIAVARAMLAREGVPDSRAVLEPGFGENGHAPSYASAKTGTRARSRSVAIARAIKALRVASLRNARPCRNCGPNGVSVVLTLSDPQFSADSAVVTATATFAGRRAMLDYESVLFVLEKSRGAWVVRRACQLGIS